MGIPDEFRIVLEDINQKFDILIEGHNGLNEKLDQVNCKLDQKIQDRQTADTAFLKEIREVRTGLGEHRNNTDYWLHKC